MQRGLTLGQLLTTPIVWSRNLKIEEARRAEALLRRHAARVKKAGAERRRLLTEIEQAANKHDAARLARCSRQLSRVLSELRVIEDLSKPETKEGKDSDVYVFSSWTLKQSFRYCTARPEEGMHFILGFEQNGNGCAIGSVIVPFTYAHRSIAGAAGEHRATHRVCIEAHETGHRLLVLMHSHPGSGKHANHPSATDEATQRLWERTTRLIGGIWSRDGYLRWYSSNLKYEVQIVGSHLERISDHVWKLRADDEPLDMDPVAVGEAERVDV